VECVSEGVIGGERGIRTHGSVTYARFPGVCLKPLSHLSAENAEIDPFTGTEATVLSFHSKVGFDPGGV
jgi:hypothetical protein